MPTRPADLPDRRVAGVVQRSRCEDVDPLEHGPRRARPAACATGGVCDRRRAHVDHADSSTMLTARREAVTALAVTG